MFGDFSSITVRGYFPAVFFLRILQILNIISTAPPKGQLVCYQTLVNKIQGQKVCHFPDHQSGFFEAVGAGENLT